MVDNIYTKIMPEEEKILKKHKLFGNLIEIGRTGGMVVGGIKGLYHLMTDSGQGYMENPKQYLTALGIVIGSYLIGTALHKINDNKRQKNLQEFDRKCENTLRNLENSL